MPLTIFITGVSSGLGLTLASHALKQGSTVIGTIRNPQRASSAISQLSALSDSFHAVSLDMTDISRIPAIVLDAIRSHGPIDVLVNNAGYSVLGPFEHITLEQTRTQLDTNYFGPVALMQAIIPHFRERRSGTIINVTSVAGLTGLPSCAAYAASKHALEGASEAIAGEVSSFGIRVILVEPGAFRTEFLSSRNLILANEGKGWADDYTDEHPANVTLRRLQGCAGKQTGDPDKAAQRMWDIITATGMGEQLKERGRQGKVMRVLFGSDSLGRMKAAIEARQEALKDCEQVAKSCDYE